MACKTAAERQADRAKARGRTVKQLSKKRRILILEETDTSVGFIDPRSFNTIPLAEKVPVGVSTFSEILKGIYVDPNGQYVIGHDDTDNIYRTFEMATPGDLSTLTEDDTKQAAEKTATFHNIIRLRGAGTKWHAGVSINNWQASLSTAYDISSIGTASSEANAGSRHFQDLSEDGVHLLTVYPITGGFEYYQLSTPYDTTTKGTAISSGTFSPSLGGAYNTFQYGDDGNYVWGIGYQGTRMDVWALSTPYDPSTATHLGEYTPGLASTAGRYFCQTEFDGNIYCYDQSAGKVYQLGPSSESGAIDEYSTTYQDRFLNFTSSARSGCWSDDGLYFYYHNSLSNVLGRRTASTAFDPSTLGAEDHTVAEPASTAISFGFHVCNEGKTAMIAASTQISYATLGTAYNLSTAGAWSTTTGITPSGGFVMAKHGKTFFIGTSGAGTQSIKQYDCSTIWDPSTGSLTHTLDISDVITTTGYPDDIQLNSQGTKIYALGVSGEIHYWNMSTPWDLSTATYGGSVEFAAPLALPQSLYVNQYGDNDVYVWDGTNNDLYRYTRIGG